MWALHEMVNGYVLSCSVNRWFGATGCPVYICKGCGEYYVKGRVYQDNERDDRGGNDIDHFLRTLVIENK